MAFSRRVVMGGAVMGGAVIAGARGVAGQTETRSPELLTLRGRDAVVTIGQPLAPGDLRLVSGQIDGGGRFSQEVRFQVTRASSRAQVQAQAGALTDFASVSELRYAVFAATAAPGEATAAPAVLASAALQPGTVYILRITGDASDVDGATYQAGLTIAD